MTSFRGASRRDTGSGIASHAGVLGPAFPFASKVQCEHWQYCSLLWNIAVLQGRCAC
jgi:hypothetical protein